MEERNKPAYAKQFILMRREPLVVVYKIHGSLSEQERRDDDSIVISDNDYVQYISRMSSTEGALPAHVRNLMLEKPLLFLGYSLNDWNVRSIFEMIRQERGSEFEVKDYSVVRSFTKPEEAYCGRQRVDIVHTELQAFVGGIRGFAPAEARASGGEGSD